MRKKNSWSFLVTYNLQLQIYKAIWLQFAHAWGGGVVAQNSNNPFHYSGVRVMLYLKT